MVLNTWDVYHERNWCWIGVGALLGFTLLFNFLSLWHLFSQHSWEEGIFTSRRRNDADHRTDPMRRSLTTAECRWEQKMFKENPHPDDKQRKRLSAELGLKPRQVKFWFQNRRTQMKAQQDRAENVMLRAENDNLKSENCHLQAELRCLSCN